ncbi:MAG: hypothetical protein BWX88_02705 [Planctomycetes bacterium ADurb.Bin126]|nr:MAG: hypothetical protein BWX88_02705 [Planctomycetes bacterium ADurb.Bin126]HOD81389.1 hypothetical protein [Phycisphaerae bacterium]HQL76282.1 hypothetical protein [Phycisphaerae bacterium]
MDPRDMDEPLAELWRPRDLFQATAIKQELEAQGIPCTIESNAYAWLYGGRLRVITFLRFRERALEIIRGRDWPSYAP